MGRFADFPDFFGRQAEVFEEALVRVRMPLPEERVQAVLLMPAPSSRATNWSLVISFMGGGVVERRQECRCAHRPL